MNVNNIIDPTKIGIARRLKDKIIRTNDNGCFLVNGSHNAGYGQMKIDGKILLAHRVSYELFKGPLNKLICCHKCDIRNCVNPEHLFAGTITDNMVDMLQKERSMLQLLTINQVIEIKQSLINGSLPQGLAKKYNVSSNCIRNIKEGKRWSHV